MSTTSQDVMEENGCRQRPSDAVSLIIEPRKKDLGGFSVIRLLPFAQRRMVGPWVFFDHMGPAYFKPGEGIDVRPHPHINLATVTYLFEGQIMHRDSVGSFAPVEPGDINLMVAGRGIVHSERTAPELKTQGQRLNGLQLWLALPEADEETDPAFYHYPKEQMPATQAGRAHVRVMIGEAYGVKSPVKTFARTLYVEVRLKAGESICLPKEEEIAAYVVNGSIETGGTQVGEHHMAVFENHSEAELTVKEDSLLVLIGGETLGKRHIFWNFVSSRPERIEQAKDDWKNGIFPVIDGDSDEFIPLPE